MLFHEWLLNEGGNSRWIDRKTGTTIGYAEKIDMSKFNRHLFINEFMKMFKALNEIFHKQNGEYLWKNFSVVSNLSVFNGSSKAFFDKSISDEKFIAKKPKVGDIDIMIPSINGKVLFDFLESIEGKQITSTIKYNGNNKPSSKGINQINAVFEYREGNNVVNAQIDFEFSEFENDKPTEWASFSHSSDWEDIENNMKGYAHKVTLMNAFRANSKKNDVYVVTKKEAEKIASMSSKDKYSPKVSKSKEFIEPTFVGFSVDKGARLKFTPVYWNDGEKVKVDGKQVYKKLETKDSKYSTYLEEIFVMLFNKEPKGSDMKDFNSFMGLMRLFKKHLDKKVIEETLKQLVDKSMFGKSSQKLSRDDPNEDMEVKFAIVNQFQKNFSYLKSMSSYIKKVSDEYYKNYSAKEMSE